MRSCVTDCQSVFVKGQGPGGAVGPGEGTGRRPAGRRFSLTSRDFPPTVEGGSSTSRYLRARITAAGRLRQDARDTAGRAPQSEEASHAMTANSFGSRATLRAGGTDHVIYRLDAVEGAGSLPFSLKVLLENL